MNASPVTVWQASVSRPPLPYSVLWAWLSVEERARAERFHFEADRQRFVLGRGLLRRALGQALDLPPGRVALAANANGKPTLAEPGPPALDFNVSHSGDVVLLALARGRAVGVDVEAERAGPDLERLAERYFSPAEVAALAALPAPERPAAFFRCWARKEAYVKARGLGLALGLDSFSVPLAPAPPCALLATLTDPVTGGAWSLFNLEVGAGYAAALVSEGEQVPIEVTTPEAAWS